MKEKSFKKRLAIIITAVMAVALIIGFTVPNAWATVEPVRVDKTATPDSGHRLQWDQTLSVTGSETTEDVTVDVLLIIDNSLSMTLNESPRLAQAKNAAKALIDALVEDENGDPKQNVDAKFALVTFSTTGVVVTGYTDAATAKQKIDQIGSIEYTNIADGIIKGLSLTPRDNAQKYAVLLSDGEPNRFNVTQNNTYYRKTTGNNYSALQTGTTYGNNTSSYYDVYTRSGSPGSYHYTLLTDRGPYYFAQQMGASLRSVYNVYTVGLEVSGDAVTLLQSIGTYMSSDAAQLVATFESISASILAVGTDAYVEDTVPSYLEIVPGSFVENGTSIPDTDITFDAGNPNKFTWELPNDLDANTQTLTFSVRLKSAEEATYSGTTNLQLNPDAVLYYKDRSDPPADMQLPFPDPTGVVPGIEIEKTVYSVNGDTNATTALPGDTIRYKFVVTNKAGATQPLSGVIITDDLIASDPDFNIGNLSTSETVYADYTIPASMTDWDNDWPLVNTATVNGYWQYSAWSVSDTDSASIGFTPEYELELTKTGKWIDGNANGYPDAGEVIEYEFSVENLGNMALTNVTVTDAKVSVSGGPTTLDVGETDSTTFTAAYTLTQADIDAGKVDNTATADSDESDPDSDDETVTLAQNPALELTKSGSWDDADDSGYPDAGEVINYTFTVKNLGNVTLTNVTVTDPKVSVSGGPTTLSVGETDSTTFTAAYTLTQADIDAGKVDNTATADSDESGPDSDDETVTLAQNPALELTKSGSWTDGNANGYPDAGEVIHYTFTVKNLGNVTLTNVTVTDPKVSVSGGPVTLAVGQTDSTTFTAAYTLTQADINAGKVDNTATADSDESGPDSDDETVTLAQNPALELTKSGTWIDGDSDGYPEPGDEIRYTFTVKNLGNVTLTNVTVTDPKVTVSGGPVTLAVGQTDSTTFTAAYTLTQADIDAGKVDNTATADSDESDPDTDDETVELTQNAALELIKEGAWVDGDGSGFPDAGEVINYTFTVKNLGNVTLTNVTVTDPKVTVSGGPTTLSVGETDSTTFTATYTLTQADIDAGKVDNTATADSDESEPDTDDETVTLAHNPALSIDKQIISMPDPVYEYDSVTYRVIVTNTGNQTLTNIVVTDDQKDPAALGTIASLAPGASYTFTPDYSLIMPAVPDEDADGQYDFTNTATATCGSISDTDSETVTVHKRTYGISIVKEADQTSVFEGETVNYTVTITNHGNQALSDVNVSDDKYDLSGENPISLAPAGQTGDSVTLHYSIVMGSVDEDTNFTNTAEVTAMEGTLSDSDDATVLIKNRTYEFGVEKSADKDSVFEGEEVTYTVTITNYGNQAMSGITVADDQYDLTGYGPYELAAAGEEGDSVSFQYTMTMAQVDADTNFDNTVTATWEEKPVSDTETVLVKDRTYVIEITKDASKDEVYLGETVTYTIKIKNTGNQPLSNIKVTDAQLGYDSTTADPENADIIGTLNPGEEWSVQLTRTMDALGAFTNTAKVESNDEQPAFDPKEDTATVNVIPVPDYAVTITKTVDNAAITTGQPSTFTITVKNVGNQDLAQVLVKDDTLGFSQTVSLTAGETKTFTMSTTYPAAGTYVNTATAEDPTGELFEKVTAQATVTVTDLVIDEPDTPTGDVDDNPHTAQGNGWFVIVGILTAMIAGLAILESRRHAMARKHR